MGVSAKTDINGVSIYDCFFNEQDGNSLVKHLVLECGVEEGASIELGKRKAAVKQIQQVQATSGATSAKRKRGADFEPEPAQPSGSGFTSNAGSGKKFEDVVGEPFTEVFNTSSSNSVGSTPVKTSVPKQAKGRLSVCIFFLIRKKENLKNTVFLHCLMASYLCQKRRTYSKYI